MQYSTNANGVAEIRNVGANFFPNVKSEKNRKGVIRQHVHAWEYQGIMHVFVINAV